MVDWAKLDLTDQKPISTWNKTCIWIDMNTYENSWIRNIKNGICAVHIGPINRQNNDRSPGSTTESCLVLPLENIMIRVCAKFVLGLIVSYCSSGHTNYVGEFNTKRKQQTGIQISSSISNSSKSTARNSDNSKNSKNSRAFENIFRRNYIKLSPFKPRKVSSIIRPQTP